MGAGSEESETPEAQSLEQSGLDLRVIARKIAQGDELTVAERAAASDALFHAKADAKIVPAEDAANALEGFADAAMRLRADYSIEQPDADEEEQAAFHADLQSLSEHISFTRLSTIGDSLTPLSALLHVELRYRRLESQCYRRRLYQYVYPEAQRNRAQVERSDPGIARIFTSLCGAHYKDYAATDLWSHFVQKLRDEGLDPVLNEDPTDKRKTSVLYGEKKEMTCGTFANRISKGRKITRAG